MTPEHTVHVRFTLDPDDPGGSARRAFERLGDWADGFGLDPDGRSCAIVDRHADRGETGNAYVTTRPA